MSFGVFGKLPVKRDFIAINLPQAVLRAWETWLQREIAQSRQLLGGAWQAAFLTMPVWRFWCGQAVLGRSALGVLLPSVDGVGRCFPLTILASGAEGDGLAAPDVTAQSTLFEALEALALKALEPDCDFAGFLGEVAALPRPATAPPRPGPEDGNGDFIHMVPRTGDIEPALAAGFAGWADWQDRQSRAARSVWWTVGGADSPARVLGTQGLPAGPLFAAMVADRFEGAGEGP